MDLSLTFSSPLFEKERRAIKNGGATHAYLIEGAAGSGKHSLAYALACTFFCQAENAPCLTCPACRKVLDGVHPDVHVIAPEKNILRVDQIREMLATVYESPYEGHGKIYLLEDFHSANEQAQNALLKTLEEPPRGVTFFLLTLSTRALLPTVLSRCRKLRVPPFTAEQVRVWLEKQYPGREGLAAAAQASGGNPGNALKALEDEAFREELAAVDELFRHLQEGDAVGLASVLEKAKDELPALLVMTENRLLESLRENPDVLTLRRLKAVQDAQTAKKQNVNAGLLTDKLAYDLVKGENQWQRS